eukprot:TRINITY_DN1508_c0_g1_i3.p2 TRINITY_DN1508_c0_g1~~TRINITY_DN1508_c0_g1_i3.p2  ORF type:complete len:502 (-),score=108.56 TRINITY_DN1508_c0_g1_i3:1968-3473(-)
MAPPVDVLNDQSAWETPNANPSDKDQLVITLPASKTLQEPPEIIIVGQGVAGASLAAYLGKQGRRVLALERSLAQPERIVGELLQPGGVAILSQLGLEDSLEGIDAQKVMGYSVWFNNDMIMIPYPDVEGQKQTGRSFHHGRFIQKLRLAALSQSTVEVREATVTKLIQEGDVVKGVSYRKKDGTVEEALAPLTVVCDGCFSALRKDLTDAQYSLKSYFAGLVLDCKSPVLGHGNVVLANPTPVLLYPISSKETRALVDLPEMPKENGGIVAYMRDVIAPQIPETARDAFLDAVNQGRTKTMPNRILAASPNATKTGVVLLGDALNMRHPLTGGGMTVALTDVFNLGNALKGIDFTNSQEVGQRVEEFYVERKKPASSINILSVALYDVFSERFSDLREACFSYLKMGGFFCRGPISLLAGISRSDTLLFFHFFLVALYGVGRTVVPRCTFGNIYKAYAMLRDAVHIIQPLTVTESPNKFLIGSCKILSAIFPARIDQIAN